MVKNLWKILCLGSALFFVGCDSCTQKEAKEIKNNYNLTIYSPQQKGKESKPIENLKEDDYSKKVKSDLPKNNLTDTSHSLSKKIMTEHISNSNVENISFDSVGYAGIGISLNRIIKSILPNLNKPMFEIHSPLNLPLTPDLTKRDAPVETYLDSQQTKAGFYISIPLD